MPNEDDFKRKYKLQQEVEEIQRRNIEDFRITNELLISENEILKESCKNIRVNEVPTKEDG